MKIRQLDPGDGTDFTFPVILETDQPIIIQVEVAGGLSYSFEIEEVKHGFIKVRCENSIGVWPVADNTIKLSAHHDDPDKLKLYQESEAADE